MTKHLSKIGIIILASFLIGCGETEPSVEPMPENNIQSTEETDKKEQEAVSDAVKVQLNKNKITIRVGESFQLKAAGVSAADVKWSIDKKKIASVSPQGVVKGKKKGTAKAVATVGDKKYTCKVKVLPAEKRKKNKGEYYYFRYPDRLTEHYKKHGIEMGFESEDSYLDGANAVINNASALHKLESEDNDHVYFLESTGEIVFLSQDGFIRTYFKTDRDYYNRQ